MVVRFLTWRRGLLLLLVACGAAFAILRLVPSGDYIFVPNSARPVAPLVVVPNDQPAVGPGGIYMVDISVQRANLLDQLFPELNDKATLVPREELNPEGVSEEQRDQRSELQMVTSQEISAVVALRALGYGVIAEPNGAIVDLVYPEGTASGVLQPGDIIMELNGHQIQLLADVAPAMAEVEPGASVTLTFERSGALQDVSLPTVRSPNDPNRAVIGVRIQQAAHVELPLEIEIDTGNVGGPSAGLAFALDIVEELGPDLVRGRTIVVTGQLGMRGAVTAVGGVKQKAFGAREVDADIFIVPKDRGNSEVAEQYRGDVQIISVETFDEAVEALTGEPAANLAIARSNGGHSQAAGG
ncbi:MAG: PDZ domain-containing protein [Actinomycetia bacterium]|nr:PDZ domain-containing protein [Actinomycetes bacterium]